MPSTEQDLKLCYFLFVLKWNERCSVVSDSFRPHRLYSPWNSPGHNTGVGSCSLLQGIFPTQGSNPGLPHCRQILYQLSHKESPIILEWVAYPFSRGPSWPRNWTGVSCIVGGFFTNGAIREAQLPIILWACLSWPHLSVITQIIVKASWNEYNNSNKDGLLGSYYFPGISRHELIPTLKASFGEMHQCLWISEEIEAQRS